MEWIINPQEGVQTAHGICAITRPCWFDDCTYTPGCYCWGYCTNCPCNGSGGKSVPLSEQNIY